MYVYAFKMSIKKCINIYIHVQYNAWQNHKMEPFPKPKSWECQVSATQNRDDKLAMVSTYN